MKSYRPLLALCLVACLGDDAMDLSMQFKETPFRQVPGIQLDMTAKHLRSLRPAAKFAPYLGMQERLPGSVVSYTFPGSMRDDAGASVPDNDKLEGVFITQTFESIEKAEALWREKVSAVASSHRAPTTCETFPTGGMQARWMAGKQTLAIGVFPKEPLAPTVGDRVIFAITRTDYLKQPAGGKKVACPTT
jgi:hypothetical protein